MKQIYVVLCTLVFSPIALAELKPGIEIGIGGGRQNESYSLEGITHGIKGGRNIDFDTRSTSHNSVSLRYFSEKHPYGARIRGYRSVTEVADIRGSLPNPFAITRKGVLAQGYYFPLENHSADWIRPLALSVGYGFERKEAQDTTPRQLATSYIAHGPILGFMYARPVMPKWSLSAELGYNHLFITHFAESQKRTGYLINAYQSETYLHIVYDVTDRIDFRFGAEWRYERRSFDGTGDRTTSGDAEERFSTLTLPLEVRYHF